MKLQLYPPPINICFLFSFQVFFSHFMVLVPIDTRVVPPTQCRNPSDNPFENPFNNLISSISSRFILVYPIFTRITTISSLMSLRYCHFCHRNHIFTYLQTGMIFWLNDALIWHCSPFLIRERDTCGPAFFTCVPTLSARLAFYL